MARRIPAELQNQAVAVARDRQVGLSLAARGVWLALAFAGFGESCSTPPIAVERSLGPDGAEGTIAYASGPRRTRELDDSMNSAPIFLEYSYAGLNRRLGSAATEPGETLLHFVHFSDVQMKDESVVIESEAWSRFLDRMPPSTTTLLPPDLERYDVSAYAALIDGINVDLDRETPLGKPLFMVHTGDAVHVGLEAELRDFVSITSRLRLPWLSVMGNHDLAPWGVSFMPPSESLGSLRRETIKWIHGTDAGSIGARLTADLSSNRHGLDLVPRVEGGLQPRFFYSLSPEAMSDSTWWRERVSESLPLRLLFLDTYEEQVLHDGSISREQADWVEGEFEEAQRAGEFIIAFGHHDLASVMNGAGFSTFLSFTRYPRFLGYFCGHTHAFRIRNDSALKLRRRGQHKFWEVTAPSIQQHPKAALAVRLGRLMDGRLFFDITPFWWDDVTVDLPEERLRMLATSDSELRTAARARLAHRAAASEAQPALNHGSTYRLLTASTLP